VGGKAKGESPSRGSPEKKTLSRQAPDWPSLQKKFLTAQERLDPFQSEKYKPNNSFFHPKKGNSLAKKRTSIKGPKS
jgi:hypothetical protein